ncbi:unnamed protein product [Vicia faba]|uniref:Uncharacterized protein n=1 Tax=Vicia faba TaxID=3906 RepID=A0AAV0YEB8_VICFA|nr:unnamed protein product [Vicia faba]
MTYFAVGHEELLVSEASSQEVKDSKAHYTLTNEKVSSFERDRSRLHIHLDQVSPFLEKVDLNESPTTLVGHILKQSCLKRISLVLIRWKSWLGPGKTWSYLNITLHVIQDCSPAKGKILLPALKFDSDRGGRLRTPLQNTLGLARSERGAPTMQNCV